MRILLDNCLPADLAPHARGHRVVTAIEMGWAALNDSESLDAIDDTVDVLMTADKSSRFQQHVADRPFAVVILRAKSSRVEPLARLISELLRVLEDIEPGQVREIEH